MTKGQELFNKKWSLKHCDILKRLSQPNSKKHNESKKFIPQKYYTRFLSKKIPELILKVEVNYEKIVNQCFKGIKEYILARNCHTLACLKLTRHDEIKVRLKQHLKQIKIKNGESYRHAYQTVLNRYRHRPNPDEFTKKHFSQNLNLLSRLDAWNKFYDAAYKRDDFWTYLLMTALIKHPLRRINSELELALKQKCDLYKEALEKALLGEENQSGWLNKTYIGECHEFDFKGLEFHLSDEEKALLEQHKPQLKSVLALQQEWMGNKKESQPYYATLDYDSLFCLWQNLQTRKKLLKMVEGECRQEEKLSGFFGILKYVVVCIAQFIYDTILPLTFFNRKIPESLKSQYRIQLKKKIEENQREEIKVLRTLVKKVEIYEQFGHDDLLVGLTQQLENNGVTVIKDKIAEEPFAYEDLDFLHLKGQCVGHYVLNEMANGKTSQRKDKKSDNVIINKIYEIIVDHTKQILGKKYVNSDPLCNRSEHGIGKRNGIYFRNSVDLWKRFNNLQHFKNTIVWLPESAAASAIRGNSIIVYTYNRLEQPLSIHPNFSIKKLKSTYLDAQEAAAEGQHHYQQLFVAKEQLKKFTTQHWFDLAIAYLCQKPLYKFYSTIKLKFTSAVKELKVNHQNFLLAEKNRVEEMINKMVSQHQLATHEEVIKTHEAIKNLVIFSHQLKTERHFKIKAYMEYRNYVMFKISQSLKNGTLALEESAFIFDCFGKNKEAAAIRTVLKNINDPIDGLVQLTAAIKLIYIRFSYYAKDCHERDFFRSVAASYLKRKSNQKCEVFDSLEIYWLGFLNKYAREELVAWLVEQIPYKKKMVAAWFNSQHKLLSIDQAKINQEIAFLELDKHPIISQIIYETPALTSTTKHLWSQLQNNIQYYCQFYDDLSDQSRLPILIRLANDDSLLVYLTRLLNDKLTNIFHLSSSYTYYEIRTALQQRKFSIKDKKPIYEHSMLQSLIVNKIDSFVNLAEVENCLEVMLCFSDKVSQVHLIKKIHSMIEYLSSEEHELLPINQSLLKIQNNFNLQHARDTEFSEFSENLTQLVKATSLFINYLSDEHLNEINHYHQLEEDIGKHNCSLFVKWLLKHVKSIKKENINLTENQVNFVKNLLTLNKWFKQYDIDDQLLKTVENESQVLLKGKIRVEVSQLLTNLRLSVVSSNPLNDRSDNTLEKKRQTMLTVIEKLKDIVLEKSNQHDFNVDPVASQFIEAFKRELIIFMREMVQTFDATVHPLIAILCKTIRDELCDSNYHSDWPLGGEFANAMNLVVESSHPQLTAKKFQTLLSMSIVINHDGLNYLDLHQAKVMKYCLNEADKTSLTKTLQDKIHWYSNQNLQNHIDTAALSAFMTYVNDPGFSQRTPESDVLQDYQWAYSLDRELTDIYNMPVCTISKLTLKRSRVKQFFKNSCLAEHPYWKEWLIKIANFPLNKSRDNPKKILLAMHVLRYVPGANEIINQHDLIAKQYHNIRERLKELNMCADEISSYFYLDYDLKAFHSAIISHLPMGKFADQTKSIHEFYRDIEKNRIVVNSLCYKITKILEEGQLHLFRIKKSELKLLHYYLPAKYKQQLSDRCETIQQSAICDQAKLFFNSLASYFKGKCEFNQIAFPVKNLPQEAQSRLFLWNETKSAVKCESQSMRSPPTHSS